MYVSKYIYELTTNLRLKRNGLTDRLFQAR